LRAHSAARSAHDTARSAVAACSEPSWAAACHARTPRSKSARRAAAPADLAVISP